MENITQIVHKVKQAPWRVQLQWIGLLLLVLVLVAMVAGIYINVTAKAAISGRQIQLLTYEIDNNKQINANMETKRAELTASEGMQARAEDLGFHPATTDEITYVAVPGFMNKSPANLSIPGASAQPSVLKAEYSETLFDWFTRKITASGVKP
jgi:cell division protein FtsL